MNILPNNNPLLMSDVYKLGHEGFYPDKLDYINSYLTTRTAKRYKNVLFYGLQAQIQRTIMSPPTTENVEEFLDTHNEILGYAASERLQERLFNLVELGYWPLKIRAVKEGTILPHHQCLMTVENTHPEFAWLVGFFESMLLKVWNSCSVATNSRKYLNLVHKFANQTCDNKDHIPFSVHDFGYRGTSSEETSELAGMGHLVSFLGTDTIPAVRGAKAYYKATTPVGLSVPATEHSTMATNIMMVMDILENGGTYMGYDYGSSDFVDVFKEDKRLFAEALVWKEIITVKHPSGIVSVVSDTYDYWGVLTVVAPWLKDDIEARTGGPVGDKVVFRPDSGDPQKIICGTLYDGQEREDRTAPEQYYYGSLDALERTFGCTLNEKGYKVINPKVGLIYGDGMYFERFESILASMTQLRYASSNLVIGVGGLLLQQHSRDDLGFAVKATYAEVEGSAIEVYKDPKTDSKKKSHKGLMKLTNDDGVFVTVDQQVKGDTEGCHLELVYEDGTLHRYQTFSEIREYALLANNEI